MADSDSKSLTRAGHVLVAADGRVVEMDTCFCEIMRAPDTSLRGRPVLDMTAPADRDECCRAIQRLRATGIPFVITKRFVRADNSMVWVRNTVSLLCDGDEPLLVATIEPLEDRSDDRCPAVLASIARFLITSQEARGEVIDRSLLSEPAWTTLLHAYVAEAEGRAIYTPALADILRVPLSVVTRWLRALTRAGLLEIEMRRPDLYEPKAYRLAASAQERLETYLVKLDQLHGEMPGQPTAERTLSFAQLAPDQGAGLVTLHNGTSLISFARALMAMERKLGELPGSQALRNPSRNILIALYVAEHDDRVFGMSNACIAAGVASRPALAVVEQLAAEGLIVRHGDAREDRRIVIRLTGKGRQLCVDYMRLLSPTALS